MPVRSLAYPGFVQFGESTRSGLRGGESKRTQSCQIYDESRIMSYRAHALKEVSC